MWDPTCRLRSASVKLQFLYSHKPIWGIFLAELGCYCLGADKDKRPVIGLPIDTDTRFPHLVVTRCFEVLYSQHLCVAGMVFLYDHLEPLECKQSCRPEVRSSSGLPANKRSQISVPKYRVSHILQSVSFVEEGSAHKGMEEAQCLNSHSWSLAAHSWSPVGANLSCLPYYLVTLRVLFHAKLGS